MLSLLCIAGIVFLCLLLKKRNVLQSNGQTKYFLEMDEIIKNHSILTLGRIAFFASFILFFLSACINGYTPVSEEIRENPIMLISGIVFFSLLAFYEILQLPYTTKMRRKNGVYPIVSSIYTMSFSALLIYLLLFYL